MTNQELFIQTFGIDAWQQMIVSTGIADQFKEFWTSQSVQRTSNADKKHVENTLDDAISRQWLMRKATERFYTTNYFNHITKMIEEAPPVRPQEQTGRWSRKTKVDAYDIAGVKTWGIKCQCDKCDFTTIVVEDFGYYKFCPNCGCRMVEESEVRNEKDTTIFYQSNKRY